MATLLLGPIRAVSKLHLPQLSDRTLVAGGATLTVLLVAATLSASPSAVRDRSNATRATAERVATPQSDAPAPSLGVLGRTLVEPTVGGRDADAAATGSPNGLAGATVPPAPNATQAADDAVKPPAAAVAAADNAAPDEAAAAPAATGRLFLHVPGTLADGLAVAGDLARTFARLGYHVADIRTVNFTVSQPRVRYFFAKDAAVATQLAREMAEFGLLTRTVSGRVVVQDYRHFRPLPNPGNIEVWLPSTTSPPSVRPTTATTPASVYQTM